MIPSAANKTARVACIVHRPSQISSRRLPNITNIIDRIYHEQQKAIGTSQTGKRVQVETWRHGRRVRARRPAQGQNFPKERSRPSQKGMYLEKSLSFVWRGASRHRKMRRTWYDGAPCLPMPLLQRVAPHLSSRSVRSTSGRGPAPGLNAFSCYPQKSPPRFWGELACRVIARTLCADPSDLADGARSFRDRALLCKDGQLGFSSFR